jgi:hypothetical protein
MEHKLTVAQLVKDSHDSILPWSQELATGPCRKSNQSTLLRFITYPFFFTINLPLILCGDETWSFTLGEESKLQVFGDKLMRKIFTNK